MARCVRFTIVVTLFLACYPCSAHAQSASKADALLAQALAVGGRSSESTNNGFSGTGSITYYWADKDVKATVTVRSRGNDQFRLDAALLDGTRSWAVSHGAGSVKEADGTRSAIHSYNAFSNGSLCDPLIRIAALMNESGVQTSYLGIETVEGRSTHHVRIQALPGRIHCTSLTPYRAYPKLAAQGQWLGAPGTSQS